MSNEKSEASGKRRQELLDELYYVKDVAGEREQRIAALQSELARATTALELLQRSRSWRMTAPLRWLCGRLRGDWRSAEVSRRSAEVGTKTSPSAYPSLMDIFAEEHAVTQFYGPTGQAGTQRAKAGVPHLFVDVTELSLRKGKTGVQRVTREILRALLASPPAGYFVQPVCCATDGGYYNVGAVDRRPGSNSRTGLIAAQAGDIFLGLDHAMHSVVEHEATFASMRAQGVRIYFVCHDVLPLSRPDCFPPEVSDVFRTWIETIARNADGVVCDSQATAQALHNWLDALQVPRAAPLLIGHFHLGADLPSDTKNSVGTPEEAACLERLQTGVSFLMVGTVEPRKGHAQTLEAFNELWEDGEDVNLVLVGLPGWMTEVTARRIRHHDEFGQRLFWFAGSSDAFLDALYTNCTALLMPSEGEGFGLPVIEASRRGLPVLCRDLPVFREIAGGNVSYFKANNGEELAAAIRQWLHLFQSGAVPSSSGIGCSTWAQSAEQLVDVILRDRWEHRWLPGETFWFPAVDPRMQLRGAMLEQGRARPEGTADWSLQAWSIAITRGRFRFRVHGKSFGGMTKGSVEVALGPIWRQSLLTMRNTHVVEESEVLFESEIELTDDFLDFLIRLEVKECADLTIEGFSLEPIRARGLTCATIGSPK